MSNSIHHIALLVDQTTLAGCCRKEGGDGGTQPIMPIGHDQIHLCCSPAAHILSKAAPAVFVAPGAQERLANTSLFPSRSTPRAVKMMVESVFSPCRTVKWIPSR